jgi:uncharacterized DUF497 family protein
MNSQMGIYEWDSGKAVANLAKHGVAFFAVATFDWSTALVIEDDRMDYGEARFIAVGFIGNRLYVLCFTYRGLNIRVISLRKANARERKLYHGS